MIKPFAMAAAALLTVACTALPEDHPPTEDDLISGGRATPNGAAFMGYHGPVVQQRQQDDAAE